MPESDLQFGDTPFSVALPLTEAEASADPEIAMRPPHPDPEAARAFENAISGLLTDNWGRLARFAMAHSPYLRQSLSRDGDVLVTLAQDGADAAVATILEEMKAAESDQARDIKAVMRRLRRGKRRLSLAAGLADIAGLWPLEKVTQALSDAAGTALDEALAAALADVGGAPRPLGRGVTILGMGKLGARELNYSSDIDIIVLYDPARFERAEPDRLRQDMVRATRLLMRIMDERTADGYVFRTDLRLRPDPGMTPLAMSVGAAETYYESVGQNWERAAMIKARPVAGDIALGESFLAHIRPFIWRKHLDFAAIQDIHSIKRQINAHRGGGVVAIEGHNIKIGRGGIREIEFFAQTQQLIWGGRQPALRCRGTIPALSALADAGHVRPEVLEEMSSAYRFLRTVEHRLQMVNDEQTHSLPKTLDGLAEIARFAGYEDYEPFRKQVLSTLLTVEGHYAALFEEAADLGGDGALVFTGIEDDPETLETLSGMGFKDPSRTAARVRIWHHGRYRATRSERARQILTELMPTLLGALSKTADPDDAFIRFDQFLEGLPAGVQLFSLFHAHPQLLDLVAELMGNAPRLADWLARKPILLDAVMSPDFFDPDEPAQAMREALEALLGHATHFEEVLDGVRRWTNDRKFQIGVQLLRGIADGDRVGATVSDVAETALGALTQAVIDSFVERHGSVPGAGLAIVAFGKLGGRELLHRSDLDLVFVYDVAEGAEASDGEKPLGPAVYYLRLCQRLVTAISSETAEGRLFEVDNRLRPAGRSGPLATQLGTFEGYYAPDGEAWTWEHMALSRARVISASAALRARLDESIRVALCQPRDPEKLVKDIAEMRARIRRQYPGEAAWDIKYRRGGLVDLEFVAQYLVLRHANDHPAIVRGNTGQALAALRDHALLSDEDAEVMIGGLRLWRRLQAVIRLTTDGDFDPDNAPEGQKRALAMAAQEESFDALRKRVNDVAKAVSDVHERLLTEPARAAGFVEGA